MGRKGKEARQEERRERKRSGLLGNRGVKEKEEQGKKSEREKLERGKRDEGRKKTEEKGGRDRARPTAIFDWRIGEHKKKKIDC